MLVQPFTQLRCPLDGTPLTLCTKHWQCQHGHSFDVARQGYVNLLPVQHKKAKEPGDSKAMVRARRAFLQRGYYQPIAEALAPMLPPSTTPWHCLDAGCGEGYYLRELARLHSAPLRLIGVDISKWAVLDAAKQHKHITWVVGSNANLPVASNSLDYVFCLFGFPVYEEFVRVLKPNGQLIMIDPTPHHLRSLRNALYADVKEKPARNYTAPAGFQLVQEKVVEHAFTLNESDAIEQLILMTPHWFRAQQNSREQLINQGHLSTQLSVTVRALIKTN